MFYRSFSTTNSNLSVLQEKELRRVFDMLCNLKRKSQIRDEVYRVKKQLEDARARENPDPRVTVNHKKLHEEDEAVQRQVDALLQELSELENKPDRKMAVCDIMEMTKQLHQPLAKKEAQEIIWEIDDDLDQCLDWPEFRLMFTRNITDKTGLEPSKMFFLTQFLIYDHNENGRVSVDETMNMLYARYGRTKMETKLRELFGENMHETGREGGEITYQEFLQAVERIQQQTFWATAPGKIAASKGGKPTI
jgi:Ca2+-binding EF-hand superfamily protein